MTKTPALVALFLLAMPIPVTSTVAQSNDAYSQALNEYTSVKTPFLKQYEGKLASSGYEFTKYATQFFGVRGIPWDYIDYAKKAASSRSAEPYDLLKLMLKRGAATYGTDAGAVLFKNLKGPQAEAIASKLSALGFKKGEDLHEFQHKLAGVATGLGDDPQSSFVMDVLTQSMIQFNPTFAAAYTGYKLAQEGYKAMARWVGNETTRAMFVDLQRYDPDASNPNNRDVTLILQQRTFEAAELAEPRRILTNHNRATGKPPPTDREVKIFILQQYNAWDEEKQRRAAEAPLLQRAQAYYDALEQFEKEKMLEEEGEDLDEAAFASRFMDEYMKIYRSLMAMKGDHPWPAQGKAYVEQLAFDLLKRKLDNYADDPAKYEDWFYDQMQIIGWVKKPDQKQIDNAARYLSSLMLTAPEKIGILGPPDGYGNAGRRQELPMLGWTMVRGWHVPLYRPARRRFRRARGRGQGARVPRHRSSRRQVFCRTGGRMARSA